MFAMKPLRVLIALVMGLTMLGATAYGGSVPQKINYQGTLNTKSGGLANGNFNMTFRIYATPTGTTPLWIETWSTAGSSPVLVTDGVFNVMLGSITPFPPEFFANNPETYLGVTVANDTEMLPRQLIASVGYALASGNGVPKGGIIMWSGTVNQIPTGWTLCDGNNGTPDLRNKFVVGAGSNYAVSQTGGVVTNNISHNHGMDHGHTVALGAVPGEGSSNGYVTVDWKDVGSSGKQVTGQHYHPTYVSGPSPGNTGHGGTTDLENRPPFYAVAFIMKL